MADIAEPTKTQKEETAYGRIVRILRQQGLTPEEIDAHPEVLNHPGRPTNEAKETAARARVASVIVQREESKGPAQGNGQGKGKKQEQPAKSAKNVPIVDAAAGPPITKLPPAMTGQWEEEGGNQGNESNQGNEGNEGGNSAE